MDYAFFILPVFLTAIQKAIGYSDFFRYIFIIQLMFVFAYLEGLLFERAKGGK